MHKTKFPIHADNYLALVLLREEKEPQLFLIPSIVWNSPNSIFVGRDYARLKSKPEWDLVLNENKLEQISDYAFGKTIETIARGGWLTALANLHPGLKAVFSLFLRPFLSLILKNLAISVKSRLQNRK